MKNFKKLSREELKNTFGGLKSCKLGVPNGNGGYTTYTGTCDTISTTFGAPGEYGLNPGISFCNTGDGVAHVLSSNGGESRC